MLIDSEDLNLVLGRIISQLSTHKKHGLQTTSRFPFILCLSGLQGSGKSTWASHIANSLRTENELKVVVLSLDDLYHDHAHLISIRESDPANELLRTRGQPGTHDEILAQKFFDSLGTGENVRVPAFDKSRFNGEGNRVSEDDWETVPSIPPIDVVIFEGWSVGFQSLDNRELERKWRAARELDVGEPNDEARGFSICTLRRHTFEHIQIINNNLRRYNNTFMNPSRFNYLVHLDTDKLANVYHWRISQEHALWKEKGKGMTDEDVVKFVQGYMPAYELYLEKLQREPFVKKEGQEETQLRVVLNSDRKVMSIEAL
jgi:D-glycerate 3-kinase